ncbi:PAS domain S-box protein [Thalassobellus citreus]|uniref:PAS domain S-box protein n=1 Tax=Thalassobellus citreus TaxID=3367752 RepID=UPI0037937B69
MKNIVPSLLRFFKIKKLSIFQFTLIVIIGSSVLSIIIISLEWGISEKIHNKEEIKRIKEEAILYQEEKLKQEVFSLISYLQFIQKDSIQYSQLEIKDKALRYFESIRFGNDGYVFVNTYTGDALLFNGKKLENPKKMLDLKYPTSINFYETQMSLAKKVEGGAFQYNFKKLTGGDKLFPKMSYVIGYDKWGWIIGAGDYLDNLDSKIAIKEKELKSKLRQDMFMVVNSFVIIFLLFILSSTLAAKFIQKQFNKFVNVIKKQSFNEKRKVSLDQIYIKDLEVIGKEILESNELVKQFGDIIDESNNEVYIFLKDDLQFIYVNKGVEQNSGYSFEELVNMNFQDIILDFNNKQFSASLENLSKTESIQFEAVHKRKNNSMYPVKVQLTKSFLNNKEVFIAFVYDITEQKKIEQELLNSKNYVQTIFDSSAEAIFIHDAVTGEILDANKQMCIMYGYDKSEVIGQTVGVFSSNKDPYTSKKAMEWIMKAKAEGKQTFEWVNKHKKGHLFWCEVSIVYVKIGKAYCSLATVRNINERKAIEQELEKYRFQLEDIVKERTQQLEDKNKSLEQVNSIFVGRELKMVELKEEIKQLKKQLK